MRDVRVRILGKSTDGEIKMLGVGIIGGLLLGMLMGLICGHIMGGNSMRESMQYDAASKGAGYYSVDQKTGGVWFQWQTFQPRTVVFRNGRYEDGP